MPTTIVRQGVYKAIWDSNNLSVTGGAATEFARLNEDGIKALLSNQTEALLTDARGKQPIDKIFQGDILGIEFTALEWTTTNLNVYWGTRKDHMAIGRFIVAGGFAKQLTLEPVDPGAAGTEDGRPTQRYIYRLTYPLGEKPVGMKAGLPPKTMPFVFETFPDLSIATPTYDYEYTMVIEEWSGSAWAQIDA